MFHLEAVLADGTEAGQCVHVDVEFVAVPLTQRYTWTSEKVARCIILSGQEIWFPCD